VGTLIWVSIPFEATRTQRHSALVEPPQQLAAGLRALVVEAHPASRAATLEVLRSLGVSGSAAVDVHGAFEQLVREGARSAYDVVIFAAASPHAGRESPFARRMLAAAGGGGPRLIKLVPMSTLTELDIHAGQGVHARLPKPVTQELLRNALLEMQFEGSNIEWRSKAVMAVAERAAHSLKASSASVGALALSHATGQLEANAEHESLEDLLEQSFELNVRLAQAGEQLEALRDELQRAQPLA
jgi:HPt (histidine-containing phosphotransfer) domain-containing protein